MMESDWDKIVRIGIAGTERLPLPVKGWREYSFLSGKTIDDVVKALHLLTAEHMFQKAAPGILHLEELPAPAALESRPACPLAVALDLQKIISGPFPQALPEFTELLRQAGFAWPSDSLPALLPHLVRNSKWKKGVMEIAGEQIRWFALQHPAWKQHFPAPGPVDWHTSSFPERLRFFEMLRITDPDQSRLLLRETWQEEPASNREAFIAAMEIRLSRKDTVLLDLALSDRSRPVRVRAASLLAQVPDSEWLKNCQALLQRTDWKKPALQEGSEQEIAGTMATLSSLKPGNEKGSELEALIGFIPPEHITPLIDKTPQKTLASWAASPAHARLLQPLLGAVLLHNNKAWADAFFAYYLEKPDYYLWKTPEMAGLLKSLDGPSWQQLASSWSEFPDLFLDHDAGFMKALTDREEPWSASLFYGVLRALDRQVRGNNMQPGSLYLRHLLVTGAYRTRAEVVEMACRQRLPDLGNNHPLRSDLQQCLGVARFRMSMQAHFSNSANSAGTNIS